ncbi:MAG TPA: ATP-binding cassette domain-containing protein, partial [Pseudolabrys sp.]|nr:ATP-binding cassette domain-containing protein [Pseudolabrys sp.]
LRSIVGFLTPASGSIVCDGISLLGRPPHAVAGMGVKYVPQDKKVFSDLTVRENLELGSYATKDYDWGRVTTFFPKLAQLMDRKAGYLSGGERQMLMIGRAILGGPKLLLVDEPTEGLAPSIVTQLKDVFRELSKQTALVIVEQNLPLVCAISERVYAMNDGRIMAELTDREMITPEACEQYL